MSVEVKLAPSQPVAASVVITLDRGAAAMLLMALGIQSTSQVRDAIKANGTKLGSTDVRYASTAAEADEHFALYKALKRALGY